MRATELTKREREIGIADTSAGYVRLARRVVGQQLPKWSGKQYPCTELRAERYQALTSVHPFVGRSVGRLVVVC